MVSILHPDILRMTTSFRCKTAASNLFTLPANGVVASNPFPKPSFTSQEYMNKGEIG
jgi:hypothetical protein